jgi:hypothetical protein
MDKLEKTNILDIVAKNKHKKTFNFKDGKGEDKSKVYKYPNRYRVNFPKTRKPLILIRDVDSLEESFIDVYKICLNEYNFKSSIRFKRYIRRHNVQEN